MHPVRILVGHRGGSGRRLVELMAVGAAGAIMLLCPTGVAVAHDCPITAPTCVVDTVQDPVGDVLTSVKDTPDTAKGEVAAIADAAEATLHDLTDPVGQLPGGGGGGGSGGGGSTGHDGGTTHHDGGGSAVGSGRPAGAVGRPIIQVRAGGAITSIGTATSDRSDAGSADSAHQTSGVTGRLGAAAAGVAASLLVVLGAVLLFMTFQARLDRRDPKLALAPVTADVVTFT